MNGNRIFNGVSDSQAAARQKRAARELAQMQRDDAERFESVKARAMAMVERVVKEYGESARESAERVAVSTIFAIFARPSATPLLAPTKQAPKSKWTKRIRR